MATDRWIDPNDNSDPWTTASDWSTGRVPTSTSNVVVAEGAPVVEAPFTVDSITNSSAIVFVDAGLSTVTGTVDVKACGLLTLDPPGPEPDGVEPHHRWRADQRGNRLGRHGPERPEFYARRSRHPDGCEHR